MDGFLSFMDWPSISWLEALCLSVAGALLVLLVSYQQWGTPKKNQQKKVLPGPWPWPIIGNLALLGPLAHQDLQKLAERYGPIFGLQLGLKKVIVVSSPQMAEEVLKTHDAVFASRPKLSQLTILAYDSQTIGSSPYGDFWRYARKVFSLELMTAKRLQEFQNARKKEVRSGLHYLLGECKEGRETCMKNIFQNLAMNIVTQMMMNKTFFGLNATVTSSEAIAVNETLDEWLRLLGVFNLGDYIPFLKPFDLQGYEKQMRATARQVDLFYQHIVDEHREALHASQEEGSQKGAMDIVDVLLTRLPNEEEKPLTDAQIKGILADIVVAGTHTTSTTMEWALTEVLKHPNVLKTAQDELDAIVGRDRLVEEADLPNLKYLSCIVKEAMRLHVAVPIMIPHESMEPCEVGGYFIPAKSQLFVNVYAIARDPKVWDRPLEFLPERFFSTTIDLHGKDFEFLPFGSGK